MAVSHHIFNNSLITNHYIISLMPCNKSYRKHY